MTNPALMPEFLLDDKLRLELNELAKREPKHIRQVADGLKGKARDNYLLALQRRKR